MAGIPIKQVAVFVVATAVIVGAAWWQSRRMVSGDPADIASDPQAVVRATQARNPQLLIEEEPGHGRPFVWVTETATGRRIQLPQKEVPGATIRFVDCDIAGIPPGMLYPHRTAMVCVDVRNDIHALSSYYFQSDDKLGSVVDFFELNVLPVRRNGIGSGREPAEVEHTERTKNDDDTRTFVVSYLLLHGSGFVGYRETMVTDPHKPG